MKTNTNQGYQRTITKWDLALLNRMIKSLDPSNKEELELRDRLKHKLSLIKNKEKQVQLAKSSTFPYEYLAFHNYL